MKATDERLNSLADELLSVLGDDIRHIKLILERLDALRAAVVRRDEQGLKCLLEDAMNEQTTYGLIEQKREMIRKEMARLLGCKISDMNLSKLGSELAGPKRDSVDQTQQELKVLCEKLRKEHMATSILLTECARFNDKLVRRILGGGCETVTYNDRGNASRQLQRGMVSIRL